MKFDYIQRVVVDAQLEVENIGSCVIQANNDFYEEFYLVVLTKLGWTEVLEYGPFVPDLKQLPASYQATYSRFEYSSNKIERIIDKFLNNPKRIITQAKVVTLPEVIDNLVNPIDRVCNMEELLHD